MCFGIFCYIFKKKNIFLHLSISNFILNYANREFIQPFKSR